MNPDLIKPKSIYDSRTKIWSVGKSKPKYGPDDSIGQLALQALLKDPEHISQICYHNGKQYTNREIATLTIRTAQHFKALKVEQCEVIGLCASNSDYVAPLFFGAMLSGLIVSTLDPSFDKDGIKHIFSITKPKIMFCDGAIYKTVKESLEEIELKATIIYTMKDHIQGVPEITDFIKETGREANFQPEPLKLGHLQTAAILCSSGTTGLPKGVCMTHASLLNTFRFYVDRDIKLLYFSTLYWFSGLWCLFGGTIGGATRIISERAFNTDDFFDAVKKYKVNVILTPPSQMALSVATPKIKEADLSSVTEYFCTGSAVPYSLAEKIKVFMPNAQIIIGYGMSEVCGAIAMGNISSDGSTGKLVSDVEVKVVDDDGNPLEPGEHGEFYIRCTYPWPGYYGNPEATAATYDEDKWIHSGDIGYIDNEGNVFVMDRKKDILKYNNFHFFPTEIENVINEMPGVAGVCVCGIPDVVSTYLPAAAIFKTAGSTLTEEDVYKYVAEKMAHFKHLRGGVYFFDDLPKTASGKTLRRAVTDICEKLRNTQNQANGKGICL